MPLSKKKYDANVEGADHKRSVPRAAFQSTLDTVVKTTLAQYYPDYKYTDDNANLRMFAGELLAGMIASEQFSKKGLQAINELIDHKAEINYLENTDEDIIKNILINQHRKRLGQQHDAAADEIAEELAEQFMLNHYRNIPKVSVTTLQLAIFHNLPLEALKKIVNGDWHDARSQSFLSRLTNREWYERKWSPILLAALFHNDSRVLDFLVSSAQNKQQDNKDALLVPINIFEAWKDLNILWHHIGDKKPSFFFGNTKIELSQEDVAIAIFRLLRASPDLRKLIKGYVAESSEKYVMQFRNTAEQLFVAISVLLQQELALAKTGNDIKALLQNGLNLYDSFVYKDFINAVPLDKNANDRTSYSDIKLRFIEMLQDNAVRLLEKLKNSNTDEYRRLKQAVLRHDLFNPQHNAKGVNQVYRDQLTRAGHTVIHVGPRHT